MAALITKIKSFGCKHYNIFIIGLFAILFLHLAVYILFFSKSLMNSDSTFIIDYAKECIKYKTLFPKTWINTNDFWVYSLIPLIIPLLKAKVPLFLARQIPALIQSGLLLFFSFDIHNRILKNKKGSLYLLFLLLAGVSGQFMLELYGDATYGTIIFFMILSLWLFLNFMKSEKNTKYIYLGVFFVINTVITACSLRFPIMIGAPLICCILVCLYVKGIKKEFLLYGFFLVLSIVIGYFLHRLLLNHLLLETAYGNQTLSSSNEFTNAISNVIFNYLWIVGGTRLNTYSLTTFIWNDHITKDSPLIIFSFIQVAFGILLLCIPFGLFKKIKKLDFNDLLVFIYSTSLSLIMLFFLLACGMYSWYRYITPIVFMLLILIPLIYKYYFNNELRNRIVFFITISILCVSSLFMVFGSYFDFSVKKIRKNPNQGLADYLVSKDLHFGYKYFGGEHGLYNLLTNGDLRVITLNPDATKPMRWLNSTDWLKKDAYKGKIFLIRKTYDNHLDIEKYAENVYSYDDNEIIVFKDNKALIDYFNKNE